MIQDGYILLPARQHRGPKGKSFETNSDHKLDKFRFFPAFGCQHGHKSRMFCMCLVQVEPRQDLHSRDIYDNRLKFFHIFPWHRKFELYQAEGPLTKQRAPFPEDIDQVHLAILCRQQVAMRRSYSKPSQDSFQLYLERDGYRGRHSL